MSETTEPEQPGALALLRARPRFRSLCVARIVSFVGDSLSLVALMLYVASSTGQALAVSVLLLVGDVAPALFSPITGAISDRFDLRKVMITCELVQGALLAIIAFTLPPLPVLLVLVALRAIAGQVFQPASRAAVPALVDDRELPTANSVIGFGTNGAEVIGPLVAAALFPFVGVSGVLLVDAASFVLSAILLCTLPTLPPNPDGDHDDSLVGQAKAGLRFIWHTRAVRVITIGFCSVVAANGIDDVALVLLAKDTFASGDSAVALLLASVGIGLIVGYALLAKYSARLSMPVLLLAGFAISSVGNLLTGLAWAVAAAFTVQAVRGLGLAAMDVASNTLLHRLVPTSMFGRVFGNLYGLIGIAAAVSYIAGGVLLDATSAPVTFVIAGAAGTLVTALTAVSLIRALR
ncbi:putative MFS family arabinose efflux permease [Herbihabitans rhizosphaerae]|uniref:Putative MFS family arabinose efflux permease n=1 Tax=Herbihabitans rhizosphaerae TaxID=1872711 RepID=A0A4Q7L3A4_9PSEU|nr:MFS transporter [Herbihabitans rhizosphaerae]RZS43715.1 putative MFS family arabinose efflux permease [Herbihabitans rhizosphaerae]